MTWRFDESDDDVQIDDHAALTLPDSDWAIAGWIKLTDSTGAGAQCFLSWGAAGADPSLSWRFYEEDHASLANKLVLRLDDADGDIAYRASAGTPGTSTVWMHLILQRSGNTYTQYVNGVADGADTEVAVDAINVATNLFFGSFPNGVDRLGGDMAEWAKWDRALDATERGQLKDGVCPIAIAGLVWWCPMISGEYSEIIVPLTVTNDGTVAATHPPIARNTIRQQRRRRAA